MGITRRQMMAATGAAALAATVRPLWAAKKAPRFRIGACDWSIGKRGQVDAFEVAKAIGLDGVQVSVGGPVSSADVRDDGVKQKYRDAAKKYGVVVSSLAMGVLNSVPYASDPRTEQWVSDSVDAAKAIGCGVILLAFFGKGDIKGKAKETAEVIRRLKRVAPSAEKAGVTLGVESWLNAQEHMHILDSVGSKAVKVYYDVANMQQQGYDLYKEIRWLGKKGAICQFHCKENGYLLGHGKVDFKKVRAAIDDAGYSGWLIIEGAVPRGKDMRQAYVHNQKYLRAVFDV